MLLRHFKPEDAQACCDVINASVTAMRGLNDAARFYIIAKNVPADLSAELQTGYSLVAEIHGHIVAVGSLSKDGEIRRIYVSPDMQKRGIGKAIMDMLEDAARKREMSEIRIHASPTSVEFYEQLGYVIVAHERTEIGNAVFETVKMTKSLATLASV